MSHYAIAKVRIQPDVRLLKEVLEGVASKLGAKLRERTVVRGWRLMRNVDFLVEMDLPYGNGYGVEITRNGIRVHVDDHGAPMTAREFANMIAKEYVTRALKNVLEEEGYAVNVEEGKEENVIYAYEVGI